MPIYVYRCTDCGHEFDVLQKVSDAPLTECPACQRPALAKKVTAAGFHLKGSGWYVTDFRDKSGGRKETGNGDAAQGGEAAAKTAEPPAPAPSEAKVSDAAPSAAKPAAPPPPAPASTD